MATGRRARSTDAHAEATGYLAWSRDWAVGIFAVLPLWLAYEGLRLTLAPDERNGAEALVRDSLMMLGPNALVLLRVAFAVTVVCAARSIARRSVPWGRVAMVSVLEGTVYGLMLGPVTGALTLYALEGGAWLVTGGIASDVIGSLGAGIFEEAVFRLGLLSVLALGLVRVARWSGAPEWTAAGVAIVVSAVVFSWFHHLGAGGEPFEFGVFVFRAMAGLVLGVLFVVRGFGICVYTHAAYDLHFYLSR